MTRQQRALLRQLASKYIWWKPPDEALATPYRVAAQVMNLGDYEDVQRLANGLGDDYLRRVVANAEPGQLNERSLPHSTLLQETPDTITALVPVGTAEVKVSFFAGLRIGRVGMPDWTEDGVLQVASLNDLFATKIKVLLQRVEAKDYLDVAAMLEHGADLAKGLASARTLYGERFQPAECLKALIYFKGGDLPSLPRATRSRLIAAVNAVRDLPKVRRSSRSLSSPSCYRPRG